uniref:Uncharacterized protein n=1 Tax=Meloidogyne floridensis TaxID=298350 RepID=A0A915NKH9_9BILA
MKSIIQITLTLLFASLVYSGNRNKASTSKSKDHKGKLVVDVDKLEILSGNNDLELFVKDQTKINVFKFLIKETKELNSEILKFFVDSKRFENFELVYATIKEEKNKILKKKFKVLDYILYLLNQHNFVNILKIKEVCNDEEIIEFLEENSLNDYYNDCDELKNIFESYGIGNEIKVSENTINEIENFFDEWANEKKKGHDNFNLNQIIKKFKEIVSEDSKVPMEDFNNYMH